MCRVGSTPWTKKPDFRWHQNFLSLWYAGNGPQKCGSSVQVQLCLDNGIAPPLVRNERLPVAAKLLGLGEVQAAQAVLDSEPRLTAHEWRSVNRTWRLEPLKRLLPTQYHSYSPGRCMYAAACQKGVVYAPRTQAHPGKCAWPLRSLPPCCLHLLRGGNT